MSTELKGVPEQLLRANKLAESNIDAALEYVDGLLALECGQTRRAVVLLRHAVVLAEADDQFDRAIRYCELLILADEKSEIARVHLARLYSEAGQLDRAKRLCADIRMEALAPEVLEMLDALELRLAGPK